MRYPHIRASHALSALALVATLCNPQDAAAATDPRLPPPRVTLASPAVGIEPATGRLAAVLLLDAPAAVGGRVGWVLERPSVTGRPRTLAHGVVRVARGATRLRFDLPVDADRVAPDRVAPDRVDGRGGSLQLRLTSAKGLRLGDALTAGVNLDQPTDLGLEPTLVTTGRFPRLATDDDGAATLVWERDGTLEGARYDDRRATGAFEIAKPTGGAGSVVTDWGAAAALTAGPDGDILVAWRGRDRAGLDHPTQLFLRFVEADDLSVGPLIAASGVDAIMEVPVVAADPGGDAWAVAWYTSVESTVGYPSFRSYARIFHRNGDPRGNVIELTVEASQNASVHSLTALGGGRFAVLWGEGGRRVLPVYHQQVFDADGQLIGTRRTLDGLQPTAVFAEGDGGFTRYASIQGSPTPMWAIDRFDRDGNPRGERITSPFDGGCDAAVSAPGHDEMLCQTRHDRSFPNRGTALTAQRFARVGAAADLRPVEYAVTGCSTFSVACGPGSGGSAAAADLRPARNRPPGSRIGWVLAYDTPGGIVAQRFAPTTLSFVHFARPDALRLAPGFTGTVDVVRSGPAESEARVRIRSLPGPSGAMPAVPIDQELVWPAGDTSPRQVAVGAPTSGGGTFSLTLSDAGGDAQIGSAQAVQVEVATDACVADAITLCLVGGRFAARVRYTQPFPDGGSLSAASFAAPYSDFTGFFWFDDPRNLELAVKVLDFGAGGIRVYYAQLTDFHFELAITDLATGRSKTYVNDNPNPCGGIDGDFNAILGGSPSPAPTVASAKSTCSPGGDGALCLLDGRYEVTSSWRNQYDGSSGLSHAQQLSDFTGLFTFGDPRNVEVLTKLLDFGDHRILFMGGSLSDLDYQVTATELSTGSAVQFENFPGSYCGWNFDSYF